MCGEKPHGSSGFFRRWDHPRVCGEKPFVTGRSTVLMGSPPRMRGKGCCTHLVIFVDGITPAYAGKSCPFLRRTSPRRDHPRACGEKCSFSLHGSPWSGSPPRMRGKVGSFQVVDVGLGITPAYAGKRFSSFPYVTQERDHPRVCGEKPNRIVWSDFKRGSPPRMRGKGSCRKACGVS